MIGFTDLHKIVQKKAAFYGGFVKDTLPSINLFKAADGKVPKRWDGDEPFDEANRRLDIDNDLLSPGIDSLRDADNIPVNENEPVIPLGPVPQTPDSSDAAAHAKLLDAIRLRMSTTPGTTGPTGSNDII